MINQDRLKELLHYNPETGVFRWHKPRQKVRVGNIAGRLTGGHRQVGINGKRYYAHRLAWLYVYGQFPDGQIDHINGIRDDNRIKNLRVAKNDAEQHQNQKLRRDNTSGYPGVSWEKRRLKWQAHIRHNRKLRHLGYFDDIKEAADAYRKAKKRLHTFHPVTRGFEYA